MADHPSWAWIGGSSTLIDAGMAGTFVPLSAYQDIILADPDNNGLIYDTDFLGTGDTTTPPAGEGVIIAGNLHQFAQFTQWQATLTTSDGDTKNIQLHVHRLVGNQLYFRLRDPDIASFVSGGYRPADIASIRLNTLQQNFASLGTVGNDDPLCFATGTLITTRDGEIRVEDLQRGDQVLTVDHGYQPILWIGHRALDKAELAARPRLRPIRIEAGALGDGMPRRALVVSPQHRILLRSRIAMRMFGQTEVLVAARQLLELDGLEVVTTSEPVRYWHIMFAGHQLVMSEGAVTESLFLGEQALRTMDADTRQEVLALFPALAAPMPAARPLIKGARARRLAGRISRNGKRPVEMIPVAAH